MRNIEGRWYRTLRDLADRGKITRIDGQPSARRGGRRDIIWISYKLKEVS